MSMIDKEVYWNTGSLYTEHGQRLGAVWDGKYIHWVDVDRGVHGSVLCSGIWGKDQLKRLAQYAYDHNLGHKRCQLEFQDRQAFEKAVVEHAPSIKRGE